MATLTVEQREEMKRSPNSPLRLIDPDTRREYVLLGAEAYDRLLGGAEPAPRELRAALERALQDDGWNDAKMDEYNRLA